MSQSSRTKNDHKTAHSIEMTNIFELIDSIKDFQYEQRKEIKSAFKRVEQLIAVEERKFKANVKKFSKLYGNEKKKEEELMVVSQNITQDDTQVLRKVSKSETYIKRITTHDPDHEKVEDIMIVFENVVETYAQIDNGDDAQNVRDEKAVKWVTPVDNEKTKDEELIVILQNITQRYENAQAAANDRTFKSNVTQSLDIDTNEMFVESATESIVEVKIFNNNEEKMILKNEDEIFVENEKSTVESGDELIAESEVKSVVESDEELCAIPLNINAQIHADKVNIKKPPIKWIASYENETESEKEVVAIFQNIFRRVENIIVDEKTTFKSYVTQYGTLHGIETENEEEKVVARNGNNKNSYMKWILVAFVMLGLPFIASIIFKNYFFCKHPRIKKSEIVFYRNITRE